MHAVLHSFCKPVNFCEFLTEIRIQKLHYICHSVGSCYIAYLYPIKMKIKKNVFNLVNADERKKIVILPVTFPCWDDLLHVD